MTALIELEDIRKTFGPVDVLKGVTMSVYPGKVSALVGDNGAGKSTLIKGLSGAQPYDAGDIRFDGERSPSTPRRTPRGSASRSSTRTSPSARTSTSSRTCSSGASGPHNGMLDGRRWKARRHDAAALSVRTMKSVRQKVSSLSGGQRQTVAIARAVLQKARVVILDEPTAALGVAQTEQVLQLVRRLADAGTAVLIISHNLADVFKVADDINVLYLGTMVAQLETKNTTYNDVIGYITGSKIKDPQ